MAYPTGASELGDVRLGLRSPRLSDQQIRIASWIVCRGYAGMCGSAAR
jgi:hypothetical protein